MGQYYAWPSRDLPALEELSLELPRPSALGRGFFTSLLAKPGSIPYGSGIQKWFEWAENQNDWHSAICPSLRVFNLHYQRWLRPSERFGFVAPLLALGWTRRKTGMPLQTLCVHMRVNNEIWKRVELVPVKSRCLLELDIPHLKCLRLGPAALEFVFQAYLTSAALSVIERLYPPYPIDCVPYLTEAACGTSFHRIRVLSIQRHWDEKSTFNVLHCFHHLEDLSLGGIWVSLYPHDVDLPLLQTLQRLCISGGSAKWLDGHTFVQLTSFSVKSISSWCDSFPNRVDMPVCTHISFDTSLEYLPMFQAAFICPIMDEWDLQWGALYREKLRAAKGATQSVAAAFSKVHARVLQLTIPIEYLHLIMIIQPIYELEELLIWPTDLAVAKRFLIALTEVIVDYPRPLTKTTPFDTQTIPQLAIATVRTCHGSERKLICPNLKVLNLRFWGVKDDERGEVRRWCVQMMEGRRRADCPLDCCYIWSGNEREKIQMR